MIATILVIFAIIEGRLSVLLVRRSGEPEAGRWALPGGRWDGSTSLDDAATTKLVDETGARDVYLEQLFTLSDLDHSQRSVAIAYFALADAGQVRLREEEDWAPGWHEVDELPELAFNNNRVIELAIERVSAKLGYTNIAYSLLPECFTLRELQMTHEAILGHPLDRRNFRKRMLSLGLIEATEESRREGPHRPARLYRFVTREPVFL